MELSPKALEILRSAVTHSWYVSAENVCDVADLLRAGFVRCEDDYDCIDVRGTDAGRDYALAAGIVIWDDDQDGRRVLSFAPKAA